MTQKTSYFDTQDMVNTNETLVAAKAVESTPMYLNPNFMYQAGAYAVPTQSAATPSTPPEPVSEPTYAKTNANFGVMRHVEPVRDHFINARLTIESLRKIATESPGTDRSLLERVEAYLEKHMGDGYTTLLHELGVEIRAKDDVMLKAMTSESAKVEARFFKKTLPKLGESTRISLGDVVDKPGEVKEIEVAHNPHSALFATGMVVADDIRTMEALRLALVKVRRRQQQMIEKQQAQLAAMEGRIKSERAHLNVLAGKRLDTVDDYAVAQRLLAEHWQEVEEAWTERQRIIDSNVGLYYVRVRETPLSRTLPDPLDLRPGSASDLAPGCPNRTGPLAEELQPFMETLLDIPAADWTALHPLANLLPGRSQLESMVLKRRQRLKLRLNQPIAPATAGQPTLSLLLQHHQSLVQAIAARPFAMTALRDMQTQGHQILALEDLFACMVPALRDPAVQLHQHLTAAACCLLSRLRTVTPSLRLTWAGLTDDDQLPVESPERWPGLEKAEADDFNAIRTLVELIGWWFRQLDVDAIGDSRTLMRNVIRACLLLAASDDPAQLLHGQLRSLPTRFLAGEMLRLTLNREPAPGNMLQLLDEEQLVIGMLRVEDHDNNGTLASIVSITNPNAALTLAMRVSGQRDG